MTIRESTPVDDLADSHVLAAAALDPLMATSIGLSGYDHLTTDLSPAGYAARAELYHHTLAKLAHLKPADAIDEVTIAAMQDRLQLNLDLFDAGEHLVDLNVIASPLQGLRDVYDIMPTDSEEHWDNIAARLHDLPTAMDGYIECLREGVRRGQAPAVRQVTEGIKQAEELAGPTSSFFISFTAGATPGGHPPASGLAERLQRGADGARAAYQKLADFLRADVAPAAPADDAVGRERYALWSKLFVGAAVDLDETYEWGLEELARVASEQHEIVRQLAGDDGTVADAVALLNEDPSRKLHGTDALREWMQATADGAIEALNGRHFDIPEPIRRIECLIAPTQNGGIYYTGPSDDFSRPGRMWWSVPPGITDFNTWREKTTVYHEGVPGHHLQIAQAVANRRDLNMWRRLVCWTSGHGEGWALYAERLMAEFGFMEDPGDRFGLLDGQRLRATRVVLDLGVHLRKQAPEIYGGGVWDAEKAWELLRANVNMDEQVLRFELNRYLGWPGQAPSYKIGQRLWEQIRTEVAAEQGDEFSLKDFHTRALNLGSLPLDVLREALTN